MTLCATCHQPATTLITARGGAQYPYRAILTCPQHRTQARAWTARAGPPTETPINQQQQPGQPQLF